MADEFDFDPVIGGVLRGGAIDRAIAALAERQNAMVARRQLLRLGIGERAIEHRLECGRLHLIYRGVYAVGHRILTPAGWLMAAVLFAGDGAVASHRSAASHWGIRMSSRSRHEVTVRIARRQCKAVQFHFADIPADEVTTIRGMPVTTVPRTIFDLAAVENRLTAERAIHEAEVKRLTDPLSLADLPERYPRRNGSATVRAILAAGDIGKTVPANDFEDAFLEFVDRHGLSRPEANVWLRLGERWVKADCLWREQRLLVELDGRGAHLTAAAFERDRSRDRAASLAGWRPVRITWRQFKEEPDALASDLCELLRRTRTASEVESEPG